MPIGKALLVYLLLATATIADTFHCPVHHYSIDLGDDWAAMSAERVKSLDWAEQKLNPSSNARIIGGFYRRGTAELQTPYVTVCVNPALAASKLSFERFEKELRLAFQNLPAQLEGPVKYMISDLKPNEMRFEPERSRAIVRMKVKMNFLASLETQVYFYPGRHEGIQLVCHFDEKSDDGDLVAMRRLADSLAFDEGFDFNSGDNFWTREWDGQTRSFMGTIVIGLIAGVAAPLIMRWRNKKRIPRADNQSPMH